MKILICSTLFLLLANHQNHAERVHPIYVSVLEVEHNQKENRLEISCKIFTNDFESMLKKNNSSVKIDLLGGMNQSIMKQLVSDYIKKHVSLQVDGKMQSMQFLGYEQADESIQSYLEIDGVKAVKKITVNDNLLYEYKSEQMSIIHVTVNGVRKSTKLNNPEEVADFRF